MNMTSGYSADHGYIKNLVNPHRSRGAWERETSDSNGLDQENVSEVSLCLVIHITCASVTFRPYILRFDVIKRRRGGKGQWGGGRDCRPSSRPIRLCVSSAFFVRIAFSPNPPGRSGGVVLRAQGMEGMSSGW